MRDADITRVLMGGFHVAHFYRLHGEVVERCFSLQIQIIFMLVKLLNARFTNPELTHIFEGRGMLLSKFCPVL